jgi:hypothetical protein
LCRSGVSHLHSNRSTSRRTKAALNALAIYYGDRITNN